MTDKITYKFDADLLKPFDLVDSIGAYRLFRTNPPASYDNRGNYHIGEFIICSDKRVIPFDDKTQGVIFNAVEIATMGRAPLKREIATASFLGIITDGVIELEHDLGNLPSPLQTICEQADKGEIER